MSERLDYPILEQYGSGRTTLDHLIDAMVCLAPEDFIRDEAKSLDLLGDLWKKATDFQGKPSNDGKSMTVEYTNGSFKKIRFSKYDPFPSNGGPGAVEDWEISFPNGGYKMRKLRVSEIRDLY